MMTLPFTVMSVVAIGAAMAIGVAEPPAGCQRERLKW